MRTHNCRGLVPGWIGLVCGLLLSAPVFGQSYSINWYTLDGGGGISTGGVFSASGTIGQPDATPTPMTNGQFSVVGGFWALPIAIQTTNSPWLTITMIGPGSAQISWTPNTPGYVLQYTESFTPTNWVNAPSGSSNPVTVPATVPTRFYRLLKP